MYDDLQRSRTLLAEAMGVGETARLEDLVTQAATRLSLAAPLFNGDRFANAGSEGLKSISTPAALGRVPLPELEATIQALRPRRTAPRNLPVSAFVITHNEYPMLELALLSLWPCEELIVVDKGSTDASRAIIKNYATRVVDAPWSPVVEDTRALADDACRHEWRIFLDADEFATPDTFALLDDIVKRDQAGDYPFDAVALPRINHLFGEQAVHNIYAPAPLVRIYRKDAYRHTGMTHDVALTDRARTETLPAGHKAAIIHFNQDNLFEYYEKANRYTETYAAHYPKPQAVQDVFDFVLAKTGEAQRQTLAKNGGLYDAVCNLITASYYILEYLKQWERERSVSVDRHYAAVVKNIFANPDRHG
jgi:glycosyltransferase involved in cell wall biosynthesis